MSGQEKTTEELIKLYNNADKEQKELSKSVHSQDYLVSFMATARSNSLTHIKNHILELIGRNVIKEQS